MYIFYGCMANGGYFVYPVGDFQCSQQRCGDPGMPLMTDMGKTKMAAETGSSFNFG